MMSMRVCVLLMVALVVVTLADASWLRPSLATREISKKADDEERSLLWRKAFELEETSLTWTANNDIRKSVPSNNDKILAVRHRRRQLQEEEDGGDQQDQQQQQEEQQQGDQQQEGDNQDGQADQQQQQEGGEDNAANDEANAAEGEDQADAEGGDGEDDADNADEAEDSSGSDGADTSSTATTAKDLWANFDNTAKGYGLWIAIGVGSFLALIAAYCCCFKRVKSTDKLKKQPLIEKRRSRSAVTTNPEIRVSSNN